MLLAAAYRALIEEVQEGQALLEDLGDEDFYAFSSGFEDTFLHAIEGSRSTE